MNQKQIAHFLFVMIASTFCWGRVDLKTTKVLSLPTEMSSSLITEEEKNKIIPSTISAYESAVDVLSKMADNTVSLWWSTTPLRNTSVGQVADKAEKKLNIQANFEDQNKVQHTFNFKVLAMQALARIEYKGWVHATLSYDARAAKTEAEITEKINAKQDLVISQSITMAESKSQVGYRWSW